MTNKISRRRALAIGVAAALVPAGASHALTKSEARDLVDRLVSDINGIIGSGKSESAMIRDFEGVFNKYGDVKTIARSSLGPAARSASSSELAAYTRAFSGYMSRKYGKRFREFIGGRIEVEATRKVKSFYEVRSRAFLRGSSPFELTFLISDRSGKNLFFNMLIEGINLLATERVEIGALLDRNGGSISGLTADLNRAG